jgi:hypothetical protein
MLQFETQVLADEFVALKLKPRVGWETCLSKILTSYPNLLNITLCDISYLNILLTE